MRFSAAFWLLPSMLGACTSGQTGSPDCAPTHSCVCDSLYSARTPLRVLAERYEAGWLEAVVVELLPSAYGASGVEVGDRIAGELLVEKPCAPDAPPSALAGGELLVLFGPGYVDGNPNCSAFQACAANCAGQSEPALSDCWNACDAQAAPSCAEQRTAALQNGIFSYAIPWAETLSFGGGNDLPRSELDVLSDPDRCLERFPPPAQPPCRDTRTAWTCAAAPLSAAPEAPSWTLWLGLAVALYAARRNVLVRG